MIKEVPSTEKFPKGVLSSPFDLPQILVFIVRDHQKSLFSYAVSLAPERISFSKLHLVPFSLQVRPMTWT